MNVPHVLKEWLSPAQIDRRTLWRWLEPEACRLAACYWWPTLPEEDIRSLMRLQASLLVTRPYAHGIAPEVRERDELFDLADEVLEQAIRDMWERHEESYGAILTIATDALRADADRGEVVTRAITCATERTPLPPPWLVQDAIEKAAREYRFETKFWQRRRRAG